MRMSRARLDGCHTAGGRRNGRIGTQPAGSGLTPNPRRIIFGPNLGFAGAEQMSEQRDNKSNWNSLEITKLVVGVLQALAVAFVGVWANRAIQQQTIQLQNQRDAEATAVAARTHGEARSEAEYDRVLEKRKEIWDSIAPKLNDTYSYIYEVGRWKELKATDLIKDKRDTDGLVFSFRSYLSDDFFNAYQTFMASAFSTFRGFGKDAQLKADARDHPKEDGAHLAGLPTDSAQAHVAYYNLQQVAAKELDLSIERPKVPEHHGP
jgi:hypothetical protein